MKNTKKEEEIVFVPFNIDGKPIENLEAWDKFLKGIESVVQDTLWGGRWLTKESSLELPYFTEEETDGPTLREWARSKNANYTLMQGLLLA